jgi:phenylalanyl-tRNA synthetase alpha chain
MNQKTRKQIIISDAEEKALIEELNKRNDIKAGRIKRFLALPDLTKKENSPVKILFDQIINLPLFKDFDLVDFPRIVTIEQCFDLLNMPQDHSSRKETDTYYLDENHILRTHTTAFWSFYLKDAKVLARLKKEGEIKALAQGIVFRKDEIDRSHYPAFHQIDGLLICKKSKKIITQQDLKDVQVELAKGIFGPDIEWKFIPDEFPYTTESLEMDIKFNGEWMEVNGAGLVHPQCLKNFGLDPEIYNGWAFGFGDRLVMIKMGIPDIRILWSNDPRITSQFNDINSRYKEVSKYPQISRDISFVIDKNINLNNYYEIVRDYAENLIEEVKLIDEYEDSEKFGKDKKSYTFRINYRSPERTLTNEEINKIQAKIREKTQQDLNAVLR